MNEIIAQATGKPLTFPDPREEARARADEFQRLSPDARFREIFAMMAFGINMVRSSPRRAEIEKRWQDEEKALSRFYQEAFVSTNDAASNSAAVLQL
jgi:hypothetical protein